MATRRTGFTRWLEKEREDPTFDKGYRRARAEIDSADKIVRALDAARVRANLSKAELARRIGAAPEKLRRLFTKSGQNPTASMLLALAKAVDCTLELVPRRKRSTKAVNDPAIRTT